MSTEATISEILATCEKFRIVSSGAGKSQLINHVFQVNDAKVSDDRPGDAEIEKPITSQQNTRFVLHDSRGFEPANLETFNIVRDFIEQKSDRNLELRDRVHAVWLCIQTPTHGARVLETGDEEVLKLAHRCQIPVVVVFTQFDRLVRQPGYKEGDFEASVQILQDAASKLRIPVPRYITVSVRKKYDKNIPVLVDITREVVDEHVKGDAWVIWSVAQRASVPLKIEACIAKGMNSYWQALSGAIPGVGHMLLHQCLATVHREIIMCWNFPDAENLLIDDKFRHLMLYVVQDMHTGSGAASAHGPEEGKVNLEKITQFLDLCTAITPAIAPPAAILGLAYLFLKWLSSEVLENTSDVQRVLIAYTVDLILVLVELLNFALLKTSTSGKMTWTELDEAFQAYYRSPLQPSVHKRVRDLVGQHGRPNLDLVIIREKIESIVKECRS
ncbi:hypothetical protein MSAN_00586500 [Mycena sanguinolenta]|uniref:G domain-containing protein n=1 Tax=Mycena sanguinolenta TaxID=230812 RepID=A0A8H7DGR5_9AGAR|nr:hypothetical protein MSAN_00586500 [Mycena sanguinolenta]